MLGRVACTSGLRHLLRQSSSWQFGQLYSTALCGWQIVLARQRTATNSPAAKIYRSYNRLGGAVADYRPRGGMELRCWSVTLNSVRVELQLYYKSIKGSQGQSASINMDYNLHISRYYLPWSAILVRAPVFLQFLSYRFRYPFSV